MAFEFVPKEFDTVELSPPALPTTVTYKFKGKTVRVLTLTYEGATENIEKVEVLNASQI